MTPETPLAETLGRIAALEAGGLDPSAPEGLTVRELAAQGRYPHQSWLRQWSKEDERAVAKALSTTGVEELPTDPWIRCRAGNANAPGSRWPSRRRPRP